MGSRRESSSFSSSVIGCLSFNRGAEPWGAAEPKLSKLKLLAN